jgi:hypothetical protein
MNPGKYRYLFTLPYGYRKWNILGELEGRPDHGEFVVEVSIK